LSRIAAAQGLTLRDDPASAGLLINLAFVWDPSWLRYVASEPGRVITLDGVPVLANLDEAAERRLVCEAMQGNCGLAPGSELSPIAFEESGGLTNSELRKRERPFMGRLEPANIRSLERASYFGAYKGVTDVLTKYLWPEWALVLTRLAARIGASPNMVTALGFILCIAAALLFYDGFYWTGLAAALGFMVLDTVDGKLARCTITSSYWGNLFDHGIDLIHPPFWWYAWGAGLVAYGTPMVDTLFWTTMAVIVGGYVLQRLIEGVFVRRFGMHIHVWRQFDSRFRLITARRNPNMVLLLVSLIAGRPDLGLIAIAAWTLISLIVHFARLVQALWWRRRRGPITSWLS
jgi:phosphatidylglycerophosphate synthase